MGVVFVDQVYSSMDSATNSQVGSRDDPRPVLRTHAFKFGSISHSKQWHIHNFLDHKKVSTLQQ
jgi:hypothetical protein